MRLMAEAAAREAAEKAEAEAAAAEKAAEKATCWASNASIARVAASGT